MSVRVRFAPSPTGYLHVGGARTALFNWLLARHAGGTFVLRIEDTDRDRSRPEMTDAIVAGLGWLGLDWDEGPYHQADGIERHRDDVRRLLERGAAYRCFCSTDVLEDRRLRAGAAREAYRYDRLCLLSVPLAESERRAAAGEPFTIRVRVPAGATRWDDAVHGTVSFDNADIEDFIILRTDGTPIYNLAVVSDDIEMRITHVIRGDDHLSNTPKQILLYHGLGAPLPVFAHVPMIMGPDGKRLSKRHGATAIGEYRHLGILPAAMVNFLALLGWSPRTDQEIFTIDELIERFSLEAINRKSAIFDVQKLFWLNGQHLSRLGPPELERVMREQLAIVGLEEAVPSPEWLRSLITLLLPRARTTHDLVRQAKPYLVEDIAYDEDAMEKHWSPREPVMGRLERLRSSFAALDDWDEAGLERQLRALATELGDGAGKLIHPLRVALTGQAVSAGIFEVATLMGRDRVLARLDRALDTLQRSQ